MVVNIHGTVLSLFVNVLFVSTNVRMQHVIILISIQISALSIPRVINDSKFKVLVNLPDRPSRPTRPLGPGHQDGTNLHFVMCHNVWRKQGLYICDDDRWAEWVPLSRLAAFIFFFPMQLSHFCFMILREVGSSEFWSVWRFEIEVSFLSTRF